MTVKGKRQTISIFWQHHPDERTEVVAVVFGTVAVHPTHRRVSSGVVERVEGSYALTHVPTGASIGHFPRLSTAREFAQKLGAHPAFGPHLSMADKASRAAAYAVWKEVRS